MTDPTPEQRAKRVLDATAFENQSPSDWQADLLVGIAAEIRAAEQAAREKALRDAANLMCPSCSQGVPVVEIDGGLFHGSGPAEVPLWMSCKAAAILRLSEEKND